MNHFCTITTFSHLYKVYALAESLKQGQNQFTLHVLVVDSNQKLVFENCKFWTLQSLNGAETLDIISKKYNADKDKLRWSLKSVFMKYVLLNKITDQIIYLDNDLFFYTDYQFLFDLLKTHTFLITPHHYKNDPKSDQNWLEANYRVGLFNAGFIGANYQAINTLQWWADCCAYRCEKSVFRGLFDDQKYLDLIPVMEEKALILRHKGCNVAGWNMHLCKRELVNQTVKINGQDPIIFIHFNDTTVREIITGNDHILTNYYREYIRVLRIYNQNLKEKDLLFTQPFSDKIKFRLWKFITELGV